MKSYSVKTPKQLGAVLRGYRKARKLTQAQVGARIGLPQKVISGVEQDPSRTSLDRVFKVMAGLDVEILLRDRKDSHSANLEW
jgi:HTH-type transcriptional regulator/antitoxin HipB